MRLWSLHPSLLDTEGFAQLWIDSLKAQKLLAEIPFRTDVASLLRFSKFPNSENIFSWYLEGLWNEANRRNLGFCYDRTKIDFGVEREIKKWKNHEVIPPKAMLVPVTNGQLWFEYRMLLTQLEYRDPVMYNILLSFDDMNGLPPVHPLFKPVQGDIEKWEMDWYVNF